jgi:hypothetical protein
VHATALKTLDVVPRIGDEFAWMTHFKIHDNIKFYKTV